MQQAGITLRGGLATEMSRGHLASMPAAIDLTGQRFGRLVAKKFVGRSGSRRLWLCECDCGSEVRVQIGNLRSGNSESCGCLNIDRIRERNTTHGMKDHPLYATWKGMRQRCLNLRNPDFKHYGGRGIKICERWNDFPAFANDMGVRLDGYTLDRIDTNGDYEPANCRWLPHVDQPRNRRPFVNANERKTHCKFGHPFDDENTRINSCSGARQCKMCDCTRAKLKRKTQHPDGAGRGAQ